jgi:hypothetical protein
MGARHKEDNRPAEPKIAPCPHWEGDLIIGSGTGSPSLVERRAVTMSCISTARWAMTIPDKTACAGRLRSRQRPMRLRSRDESSCSAAAIVDLGSARNCPITSGSPSSRSKSLCRPAQSVAGGTNENTNGLCVNTSRRALTYLAGVRKNFRPWPRR